MAARAFSKQQAHESARIQTNTRAHDHQEDLSADTIAHLVKVSPLFCVLGYACTRALVGDHLAHGAVILARGVELAREMDTVEDVILLVKGTVRVTQGTSTVSASSGPFLHECFKFKSLLNDSVTDE
jgi:hypothetical protein